MDHGKPSDYNGHQKLEGYEFWEKILNKSQYVVAPMVDQSELAWRMLSRKYGAQLCYTPMFHASVFNRSPQYRKDALTSCEGDRPLIVQFCANDPDTLVQAALVAQDYCDAIDLNLGCPQTIARRGYYGAFLSDNWELIAKLVKSCHQRLSVPITCKIRVFSEIQKTVEYAQMLESAGCQLLTVHGRTKEMKGPNTGLASWEHIKAVKDAVKIPVYANGNIQFKTDVERCMAETGVDGVMVAEGSLHNPALFTGESPVIWDIALEYLDFAEKYPPCPISYARGHVFKLCHHGLRCHVQARTMLSAASTLGEMRKAVETLRDLCQLDCSKSDAVEQRDSSLPFSHWICQPYVRPVPVKTGSVSTGKNKGENNDVATVSKKKMKKLQKRGINANAISSTDPKISDVLAKKSPKISYKFCVQCGNPGGTNCALLRCKPCCKRRRRESNLNCSFHTNYKRPLNPPTSTDSQNDESKKSLLESNMEAIT